MQYRILIPTVLACLTLAAWKSAPQSSQRDRTIMIEHVAGNLHMLTGIGGNIGVSVGADGVLVIDDKFADLAENIQKAIDELAVDAGVENPAPRFLINTHHHGDHTGSNATFGKQATIVAHSNVRRHLIEGSRPMAPSGLPIVTFDDGMSIHFNGEEVRLIHLPAAHTDGDTVVFFMDSNVVHMGDLGFTRRFPFVDLNGGGTVAGYAAALTRLLDSTDAETRFIPGHGPQSTREDVTASRDMLLDCTELVQKALDSGKSIDDMRREKLLSAYSSWSWAFISSDTLIATIAQELGE